MRFIVEQGFDVKEGKVREYQEWLQANEDEIVTHCPEGIEYLGTYTAIYTSEKSAGTFKSYWQMDSYAAHDRFAAAMREDSRFSELIGEATSFVDQANDANWSNSLFKAVVDASVWGE